VVFFLARAGVVGPQAMKTYRRHAIVVVLLLAAIITPPDLLSQILVAVPVLILYEFSIGIARRQEKKLQQRRLS
jgi:sec-independent protein translocase protein TatC